MFSLTSTGKQAALFRTHQSSKRDSSLGRGTQRFEESTQTCTEASTQRIMPLLLAPRTQINSSKLPATDKKLSRDLETEDCLKYKFIPRLLDTHLS